MNTPSAPLYEADFYAWIQQQANTLKAKDFASLDLDNLIDEIESMGRSEKRALENRLEALLIHLLQWKYQLDFRGVSGQASIKEKRSRIADHLNESPSLKNHLPEAYDQAYDYAVLGAVRETNMDESTFPTQCPWTFDQAMDADFWPEAPSQESA